MRPILSLLAYAVVLLTMAVPAYANQCKMPMPATTPLSSRCSMDCLKDVGKKGSICMRACEIACCDAEAIEYFKPENTPTPSSGTLMTANEIAAVRAAMTDIKRGIHEDGQLAAESDRRAVYYPDATYSLAKAAKKIASGQMSGHDFGKIANRTLNSYGNISHVTAKIEGILIYQEMKNLDHIKLNQQIENRDVYKNGLRNCKSVKRKSFTPLLGP